MQIIRPSFHAAQDIVGIVAGRNHGSNPGFVALLQSQNSEDEDQKRFFTEMTKIQQEYCEKLETIDNAEKTLMASQKYIASPVHQEDKVQPNVVPQKTQRFNFGTSRNKPVTKNLCTSKSCGRKTSPMCQLTEPRTVKKRNSDLPRSAITVAVPLESYRVTKSVRAVHFPIKTTIEVNPEILRIHNYVPGGIYEAEVEVVNVDSNQNSCRVGLISSDRFDVYSPSPTSYVAAGLPVPFVVVFKPQTYLPVFGCVTFIAANGSWSVLQLEAYNDSPKLDYPELLNMQICPPGVASTFHVTVTNSGEFGMFYVMKRSEFEAFDVGNYDFGAKRLQEFSEDIFKLAPASFELDNQQSIDLRIDLTPAHYCPSEFKNDFVFIDHLGHVYPFRVQGRIINISLEVVKSAPKLTTVTDDHFCHVDISAFAIHNFPENYLGTKRTLKLILHNKTDFQLKYYWRNVLPFMSSETNAAWNVDISDWVVVDPPLLPVSSIPDGQPRMQWEEENYFLPGQKMCFRAETIQSSLGLQRIVLQLIVTDVSPVNRHRKYHKEVQNSKPCVAFAVDISMKGVPLNISYPVNMTIAKKLVCHRKNRVQFPVKNNGPALFTLGLQKIIDPDNDCCEVEFFLPLSRITIDSGQLRKSTIVIVAKKTGKQAVRFFCNVKGMENASVTINFTVKGPRLKFPRYLNLGTLRIGEQKRGAFLLFNPTHLPAFWRMEFAEPENFSFAMTSYEGITGAGRKSELRVIVSCCVPCEIIQKVTVHIKDGASRKVWILASIVLPRLSITPSEFHLNQLFLNQECSVKLVVKNLTLLQTKLSWDTLKDSQYITLMPPEDILIQGLDTQEINIKLLPQLIGEFTNHHLGFLTDYQPAGNIMLSGKIAGPDLLIFLEKDGVLKRMEPDSEPMLITVGLLETQSFRFVFRNYLPMITSFTAHFLHFPETWSRDAPEVSKIRRIAAQYNDIDVAPKARALAITAVPAFASVGPNQDLDVIMNVQATMCGCYSDVLKVQLFNGLAFSFHLKFDVFQSPVRFLQSENGVAEMSLVRFARLCVGAAAETREIAVCNILPHDIITEWCTAVASDENDKTDIYGAQVHLEQWPKLKMHILNTGFPKIGGFPSENIFSVNPKRLEIRANANASLMVTFNASNILTSGSHNGILVGHARTADGFMKCEGDPWINGNYAPSIRMRLHGEVILPRLTVEKDLDNLCFRIGAGETVLSNDFTAKSTVTARLRNDSSTDVRFGLSLPNPFKISSVSSSTAMQRRPNFVSDKNGWYTLKPNETVNLDVQFILTEAQLKTIMELRQNWWDDVSIKADLGIWYLWVTAPLTIPVQLYITSPKLHCAPVELDFGTRRVQQRYEMDFNLYNIAKSTCPWKIVFENNDSSAFSVLPCQGVIGDPVDSSFLANRQMLTVAFNPSHCKLYEARLICYGLFDKPVANITVTGKGSLDCSVGE